MKTTVSEIRRSDRNSGMYAEVIFSDNTNLVYRVEFGKEGPRHDDRRTEKLVFVSGTANCEMWSVMIHSNQITVLEKNNNQYEVGQEVNHKSYGKGIITKVTNNALMIDFNGISKVMLKSIVSNFLI